MIHLSLDAASSKLAIRTRAIGVLARLAHDLEIAAEDLQGRARIEGEAWSAELSVPVAALRVAGVVHGERLDPAGLSASDRREVARKIREEILRGTGVVQVKASGTTRDRAEARVEILGGSSTVTAPLTTRDRPDGTTVVSGSAKLSMRALGVREIKGPLGAFKLRDDLEILFDLTLRPAV